MQMDSPNGIVVEAIPAELKACKQWVCWRLVERNGKPDKPPFIPASDSFASSNRPNSWRPFSVALAAYQRGGYSGIGYVFCKADHRVGIDLDACRNPETGELAAWATDVVSRIKSYTEISPSGYGVKIICAGSLPTDLQRNKFVPDGVPTFGPKEPEIAIWDHGRYFTITGQVFGEYGTIENRQVEIDWLVSRHFTTGQDRRQDNAQAEDGLAVVVERMLQVRIQDGSDGSRRLFTYCCRCVEAGLSEPDALTAIRTVERVRPFPREWSDEEIRKRLTDAERKASRGSQPSTKQGKAKKRHLIVTLSRPFPTDALPQVVGRFVSEASIAIGCDPAFIVLPTLACLARAIGNKRVIRLKRTWDEPAIIWAAIVGKSGTHKSPALKVAIAMLQRKQAVAIEDYQEAVQRYAQECAHYEREFAAWKRTKGTEPPPWEPLEPVCLRFIVSDITIEALVDRLAGQYDGVLLVRDELAGWINGIAEYKGGKGSDTGHWLSTWSGEPLTVDRKTGARKMLHVPRAAVSIVGGIQPGILRQAIGREHMQDGLCARLLLASPEPKPIVWRDDVIAANTYEAMDALLEQLLALEPAADSEGKPAPYHLPLTAAAKLKWVAYFNRHRAEQVDLDEDLAAAWSKLEAYTARFSLIFQLCNHSGAAAVDEEAVTAAITVSEWFGNEARRVYGILAEDDDEREHRELIEWIRRRGGEITVRELQQGRRDCPTADDAEAKLNELAKGGWGAWHTDTHDGGRGRPVYVFRLSTASTDNTNSLAPDENGNCVDVDSVDASENEENEWTG